MEADRVEIERLQQPNFAGGPVLIPVGKEDAQDEDTLLLCTVHKSSWVKLDGSISLLCVDESSYADGGLSFIYPLMIPYQGLISWHSSPPPPPPPRMA